MRNDLLVSLVTLPVLFGAPVASATVITFDATPITSVTSYTESGVTFTTLDVSTFSAVTDPNGSKGLLSDSSPRIEFKATLPSSVSQVSVDLGDFDADPDLLVLRAFSAGNALLDFSSLLIPDTFTGMDTLTVSGANIAYVTFGSETPSVNGSSVFADNFTFNASAVPEPATWAMMLFGFTGLGFTGLGFAGYRTPRKSVSG
jgi:hypothetical protein